MICPPLTISLGIAAYPEDGNDIEELIKRADAAMYVAKQSGKNRVEMYASGMDLILSEAQSALATGA